MKKVLERQVQPKFQRDLDVDVLLSDDLSRLPWLPGLRETPGQFPEALSACITRTQCPAPDSTSLCVFGDLLGQGTPYLNDRAKVSYEPGKEIN